MRYFGLSMMVVVLLGTAQIGCKDKKPSPAAKKKKPKPGLIIGKKFGDFELGADLSQVKALMAKKGWKGRENKPAQGGAIALAVLDANDARHYQLHFAKDKLYHIEQFFASPRDDLKPQTHVKPFEDGTRYVWINVQQKLRLDVLKSGLQRELMDVGYLESIGYVKKHELIRQIRELSKTSAVYRKAQEGQ